MKAPKWTPEEQRRSDELTAACNTLKALHELQGRLIAGLENRSGDSGYGRGKVHTHVLFPELFRQLRTSAEGMLSIAKHEQTVWEKNAPPVISAVVDDETTGPNQ